MAAAIEAAGIGADGSMASEETMGSTALLSFAPDFAASAAQSKGVGISRTATAAVANILGLNLIVVS
jgi:hypothetical protein